MKASRVKPAEHALGWFGSLLSVPFLAPIAGIVAAMVTLSKSKSRWARALMNVIAVAILIPLFLLTLIVFLPYMASLWLLSAVGLVRRDLPPTLTYIEPTQCLVLSAPLKHQPVIEELARGFAADRVDRWSDEDTANIEMYAAADVCRAFAERIEREDPVVEVHYT